MAFPDILHCLVCEGSRPEPFGKSTLLGFYGVAPDVEIAVKDPSIPVLLALVFIGGIPAESSSHALRLEFAGPKEILFEAPSTEIQVKPKKRLVMHIQLPPLQLAETGEYEVRLFVDGGQHYREKFIVRRATPEDFVD